MIELKVNQVQAIYDTILELQGSEFTALMRHNLRMIRNEIGDTYHSIGQTQQDMITDNGGQIKEDVIHFTDKEGKPSPEGQKQYLKELDAFMSSASKYNLESIPLDLQLQQGMLPAKFDLNLDPILAKE